MKRLKFGIVSFFTILITIGFSSCTPEDRYYNKSGALDIDLSLSPDVRNGYAEVYTRVRIDEMYNPSRENLVRAELTDAWIKLSNFKRGDYITDFYITVDGVGTYVYDYPISIRETGDVVIIDERPYYDFMGRVIDRLVYRGYIDVTVKFYSKIYDGGPIFFEMKNNLNLELRD